jgi:Cft2 family RNA processing exonuclease
MDPRRRTEHYVISHGHSDHLLKGGLMTPQTRDIMKARTDEDEAQVVRLGEEIPYGGFNVTLLNSGHVLGSAMVRVCSRPWAEMDGRADVVYTGDLNPEGGLTTPPPEPVPTDTLIVEATFGHVDLPNRSEVMKDMLAWARSELERSSIVFSAYEFGKAQEIIAAMNSIGAPVFTTPGIGKVSQVYIDHGIPLKYSVLDIGGTKKEKGKGVGEAVGARDGPGQGIPEGHHVLVVPNRMMREVQGIVHGYRKKGARTAHVSGWCGVFSFRRSLGVDAQFPISDHGDAEAIVAFTKACSPRKVFTVFGENEALAKRITEELGIDASPLAEVKVGRGGRPGRIVGGKKGGRKSTTNARQ